MTRPAFENLSTEMILYGEGFLREHGLDWEYSEQEFVDPEGCSHGDQR